MATQGHPRYNLSPGTLSGLYAKALRDAGHGEVKGWHCPNGNDAFVQMMDGKCFQVGVGPGNKVVITPVND